MAKEAGRGLGGSSKQIGVLIVLAFLVTLAVVVGTKMSTEAIAVVIGVVCGVAASIPTSVLLLVALTRRDRQRLEDEERRGTLAGNYPPLVVIQGGTQQALPPALQAGFWPAPPPDPAIQRRFQVVGDDMLLDG